MMWWCIYLTTIVDTINNLGYFSLLGFGMHPFVVQCVGGEEKTKSQCADYMCSLWNQCSQVWQMAIIWVAITTALGFIINVRTLDWL
ncbi:hypothetical protein BC941DRAFT_409378 [Chlamydoabsidia padenii]|nr:hypothetical protein BC941DRAFT_409378 [Chlamydoabsidia padenii]